VIVNINTFCRSSDRNYMLYIYIYTHTFVKRVETKYCTRQTGLLYGAGISPVVPPAAEL
jgi:hypothetical protein